MKLPFHLHRPFFLLTIFVLSTEKRAHIRFGSECTRGKCAWTQHAFINLHKGETWSDGHGQRWSEWTCKIIQPKTKQTSALPHGSVLQMVRFIAFDFYVQFLENKTRRGSIFLQKLCQLWLFSSAKWCFCSCFITWERFALRRRMSHYKHTLLNNKHNNINKNNNIPLISRLIETKTTTASLVWEMQYE